MKIYNKLVRNKTPYIINESGRECEWFQLEDQESKENFIKLKAMEEMSELLLADSPENQIEEIADVLEVLDTYMEVFGIKKSDVEAKKIHKAVERGGFNNFVILQKADEEK